MTRAQNSFLNFISGTFAKLLGIILNFIVRSVFIRTLGESYLGIEGLFSNILSMLSLAELGFGSAIVFRLYKPIEENDQPRMRVLMKLYRQVYAIIGWVIVGLGVCLIPFLPRLIRDYDSLAAINLNAVFIFLLYLFNSASSYWFFAYKSAFVDAAQKSYLLTVMGYAVSIASHLAEIIVLVLTHDFVAYLVTIILFSLIRNLIYAQVCDRRFPFLREKTDDRVSRAELKDFFKDCSSLFLYKISNVVIGGSDNIVLSYFLGLRYVVLYANYTSVRVNLSGLLNRFLSAMQASLGSIYTTGNLDWSRLMFRVVHFATCLVYGVGGIGVAVLSNDFIELWLGSRFVVTSFSGAAGTLATPVALLSGLEMFFTGQKYYCSTFRHAMGLFQQLRYRPVIGMLVNLFFSLVLVPFIGIAGCLASTIISSLTVNLIYDPIIIHKHGLKQSPKKYFIRNIQYYVVLGAAGLLCWWLCGLIPLAGVLGFIIHGCVCVAVSGGIFLLCFCRTAEFRFIARNIRNLIPHKAPASGVAVKEDTRDEDA